MAKALDCPKCGAPMHATPGSPVMHCQFCATDVAAPTAFRPAPAPQAPLQMQIRHVVDVRPHVVVRPSVSPLRFIIPFVAVMMSISIGGASFWRAMHAVNFGAVIKSGIAQLTQPRWLENGPQVIIADVDKDGDEDVIGLVAEYAKGANEQYLAAYDVDSKKPIWTSIHVKEPWTAHTMIAGKRLLLVEGTGAAHVIDASSGKEVATAMLSDKVSRSCVDDGRFVLSLDDKTIVAIDPKSADATPTKWPVACGPTERGNLHPIGHFEPRAKETSGYDVGVSLKGTYVARVLDDGKAFVGFATKTPGTPRPLVFSADRKTKAIGWSHALQAGDVDVRDGTPEIADLVDGTLFTVVSSRQSSPTREFLIAINASTGAERWHAELDTKAPGMDANAIVLSEERAYLPRAGQVQIYARSDGHRVAILGPQ
ncbi:MAG: PQQ-binding-like beta-propeller repeat protein [Polyangiales bacterium]